MRTQPCIHSMFPNNRLFKVHSKRLKNSKAAPSKSDVICNAITTYGITMSPTIHESIFRAQCLFG